MPYLLNPFVSNISKSPIFHIVGAVFLSVLAYVLYKKSHNISQVTEDNSMVPSDFSMLSSSFLVGMTNPKSIVGFPAALLSSGYEFDEKHILLCASLVAIGGVFSSLLWWIVFLIMSKRLNAQNNSLAVEKLRDIFLTDAIFALSRFVKIFA